jgi:glycosyltransferase involved in cell wall biosynthesis
VRTLLRETNPDVVVAVQGTIVQSNRVVEQARRLGVPVVSFIPMGVHFGPGQRLYATISRVLERYHYRRPNGFITTSFHARRELLDGGVRAPIEVVYCGVDLERVTRASRAESRKDFSISGYTIAIIGRVSIGTKGHDLALQALARIPDANLLIVGDGPDDETVNELVAKLGLRERVSRIPWQQDMSRIYAAVDMVIIPSRFEGLPMVALEAMFNELPVISADMGAMREVLPAEWIVPTNDPARLAAAVTRLRSSDNRLLLTENRARVLREFTEAGFGERFREALQQLLSAIGASS